MENHTSEKERKYNEVCGLAYVNLFTLSKNHDCILFDEIDLKNEEHLFLLHVALGLSDIVEKKVVINASRATVRRLNKKLHIKDKSARIRCAKNEIENRAIYPERVLTFMRIRAREICGPLFTFGDIYREFYKIQKGKKK